MTGGNETMLNAERKEISTQSSISRQKYLSGIKEKNTFLDERKLRKKKKTKRIVTNRSVLKEIDA